MSSVGHFYGVVLEGREKGEEEMIQSERKLKVNAMREEEGEDKGMNRLGE